MAEKQTVLFPGLRGEMAKKGVSVRDLAEVLDTSEDSIYRRLNGIVEFDLYEWGKASSIGKIFTI